MALTRTSTTTEASLARGPVLLVGTLLTAFGLLLLLKAGDTPNGRFPHGNVSGLDFLGFETNGWTAFFTITAGALLLFGAAEHTLAKSMSLLVGLALGACAIIALVDGHGVLGLAAANHATELGWAIAAAVLLVVALMPRTRRVNEYDAVRTQPAPVVVQPEPVVAQRVVAEQPIAAQPQRVVAERPVAVQPQPVYAQQPTVTEPQRVSTQPQPVYAQQPTVTEPQRVSTQPQPVYAQQPTVTEPQRVSTQPQPVYAQQPTVTEPQRVATQPQPVYAQQPAATGSQRFARQPQPVPAQSLEAPPAYAGQPVGAAPQPVGGPQRVVRGEVPAGPAYAEPMVARRSAPGVASRPGGLIEPAAEPGATAPVEPAYDPRRTER